MPCEDGPGEVRTGFAANGGEPLDEVRSELSELVSSTRPGAEDSDPSSLRLLWEDATPSKSSTRVERRTSEGAAALRDPPGAEPPWSDALADVSETVSGVPPLDPEAAIARGRRGGR